MTNLEIQEPQTKVVQFMTTVTQEKRRIDCEKAVELLAEATGMKATMWGDNLIGFGSYDYQYKSGRSGTWFLTGVSPRKQGLTIYVMPGSDNFAELIGNLGKFKTGKSCLYINKLEDINTEVLKQLISDSVAYMKEKYPTTQE